VSASDRQPSSRRGIDLQLCTLESVAIEGYRTGALTEGQIRRMLGFETRIEVHELLKNAGVPLDYTEADLEQDTAAHRKPGTEMDIESAYREMAADQDRERESFTWSESLIQDAAGDASDAPR
jgi:predicted HTH domain antitoxin